ncbi:MAG: CRISPR-associated endonuclease Cas2 [Rhodospirillum sp.]|nr:CRISPR-associated endonuclease Cas2 [Rhodospirillum sp.]MCF8501756.1 CRISPR-associated endonuclease Cas2 [Rhodospirillum sp.]
MPTPGEMVMVFCYDVADDRARRRIAAILEDGAVRVQRSVFEARLTARAADRLATKAARHLGPEDSLRVYAISAQGLRRSRAYGPLPLPEDQDFYLL